MQDPTEAEKQRMAKEVTDRLNGETETFEYDGIKFTYHKGLAEKQREFEEAREKELFDKMFKGWKP